MSPLLRPALLAALTACAAVLASAKTIIHAGSFIDGRADTVRHTVTITVDGERISAIADGYTAAAAGDTVIDLKNSTVMPGLMDMHVHITSEQSGVAGYAERFYLNPADVALRSTIYAKKTLMAGFTTVRDLGAGNNLNNSLTTPSPRAGSSARASTAPAKASPPPAATATRPTASTTNSKATPARRKA